MAAWRRRHHGANQKISMARGGIISVASSSQNGSIWRQHGVSPWWRIEQSKYQQAAAAA